MIAGGLQLRSLVHCPHGGKHGGMQADMIWRGAKSSASRSACGRKSEPQSAPSDTSFNKDTPPNSAAPYKPMGPFLLKPPHSVNFSFQQVYACVCTGRRV